MSFHVLVVKAEHYRCGHGYKDSEGLPPSPSKFTVPFCSHEDKKWAELDGFPFDCGRP